MAGIYIHIPFCRKACTYCNFHFTVNLRHREALVKCLIQELTQRRDFLDGHTINTIYLGGGTPSTLPASDIKQLTDHIYNLFPDIQEPEITLEANPDDLSFDYLQALREARINRLSIGVQTLDDNLLQRLNRSHTAAQALGCVEQAQRAGFSNISLDLIYGIPGLDHTAWLQQLKTMTNLGIQHLSCYALTVEPKTALYTYIARKEQEAPDDEDTVRQFNLLLDTLPPAGFEHYELSNFALPGYRSKHNSAYWKGLPYLGIGPSAHSYKDLERSWNLANTGLYISALNRGETLIEREPLSAENHMNETILVTLRTKEGLSLSAFRETFGEQAYSKLTSKLSFPLIKENTYIENNYIKLSRSGWMVSDAIISHLFTDCDSD